jgi:hypothetical protein
MAQSQQRPEVNKELRHAMRLSRQQYIDAKKAEAKAEKDQAKGKGKDKR